MLNIEAARSALAKNYRKLEENVERAQVYLRANQTYLLAQARTWVGRVVFWVSGITVGLAAVAFALMSEESAKLFASYSREHVWFPFVLTPSVSVFLLWLTRKYFQGAEGSGIPQVIAEMKRPVNGPWRSLINLRIAFGKVLVGVSAIGAGFSFGREGPTVQVGACLMAAVGRFLPATLRIQRHHLLVAGGSAGIAAAFNTPLAGIVFAIEELSRNIESRMSGLVITSIVLAGVVAQMWLGNHNYYGQVVVFGETSQLIQTIAFCSVVTGLAGGLFSRLLLLSAKGWKGKLADLRKTHPYYFAALCGLMIAALGWATGGLTWGSGYEATRSLLEGRESVPWYFGPAKFVATVVAYITGLPGGIFAPSLAIGAGIGRDLVPTLSAHAYSTTVIVMCMVGFLAAATQAPITSFIIVMEMVNGYSVVIALMATSLIASAVSRLVSKPLYSTLAENMVNAQRPEPPPPPPPVQATEVTTPSPQAAN